MTEQVLLAATELTRSYGRYRALASVSFELRRGEVLGFLGPNGAGKSTTMQILTGALAPDHGRVSLCGHDLRGAPAAAKRMLGYLPQVAPLYDDMLVDEYLRFSARIHGVDSSALAAAVARARQRCGLGDVGARLVRHLSGGYRQRLGIAQAIVHDPTVLILDEPTSGLDPAQIRDMRVLIAELARDRAIMLSSHILSEVRQLATRVIVLHAGRVVHDAPLQSIATALRARFVQAPDARELRGAPGVSAATVQDDGSWLIDVRPDAAANLVEYVVRQGWGIVEWVPDFDALEHLFMRLTAGAASGAPA